ncbi:hypothetical protein RJ640_014388 [Escallonia rubra]|uniref:Extradiol ring-cleavage dioxygenase class III enzyme subunit B domain-containing protein n=1 Tax=Escallonia rubra TaxID=112253 RepID=A0AA88U6A6_9ASTE|nr:hypothetical protein RJ640_014388 [Escallonia rubra]
MPGAPQLAMRVKEALVSSGFKQVDEDKKRGLDHGAWVPLMLMYPEAFQCASSPFGQGCNVSLQLELGKALAPLKDDGVVIIGSGSATHNLRALRQSNDGCIASWALEFDTWLKESLINGRHGSVILSMPVCFLPATEVSGKVYMYAALCLLLQRG